MAAANRFNRPRAPSPRQQQQPNHTDFDSDNTYSLVQDSMRDRKMTQVARIDRMFGDSANEDDFRDNRRDNRRPNVHSGNNKFGSVSSNSTNSSSLRESGGQNGLQGGQGSLSSLYHARKQGLPSMAPPLPPVFAEKGQNPNGTYDAATVEQIKAQFQAQIEAMMLSQVRKNFP